MEQPYKYNGKELDVMHGQNWYDYSARHYDPAIARFSSIDPMAEKYYSISPYVFCLNNPLLYIDPNGDTTRVYTETTKFGHSWISTGEGKNLTVYTYGNYTEDDKKDGVLYVLKGKFAKKYLDTKEDTNYEAFAISDISDNDMDAVMNKIITNVAEAQIIEKDGSTGSMKISFDEYKFFSNNCTTFTSDALHKSGSQALIRKESFLQKDGTMETKLRPVAPTALQTHLNYQSKQINTVVHKIK